MGIRARLPFMAVVGTIALVWWAMPVSAGAVMTEFTGTEQCRVAQPGTWTYPDGNWHVRGLVLECVDINSDARASGINRGILNANWDADGFGPMWGTYRLENAGGAWAGTWHGTMEPNGPNTKSVGRGEGGYEGMRTSAEIVYGVSHGRIVELPNS